jgi:glycosyltransferase involved in cell wall biosynthesis
MPSLPIGFDAKRAFCNGTGLGVYSRNLLGSLLEFYSENGYHLFTPRAEGKWFAEQGSFPVHLPPRGVPGAWWRTFGQARDAAKAGIRVYHGLSHELPYGLADRGIASVVTIHDLIYLRHPEQFGFFDRRVYDLKFRSACARADRIVAVSEQTKADLVEFYRLPPERVQVIYQANEPHFENPDFEASERHFLQNNPPLPKDYILYVGSVIPRKNLLGIVRALGVLAADGLRPPLVVVGDGKQYLRECMMEAQRLGVERQLILLGQVDRPAMPALYRGARLLAYPSVFEGFGIPIIEALRCGTPVLTSRGGCFPEAAGAGALYVSPANPAEMADALRRMLDDDALHGRLAEDGQRHVQRFSRRRAAAEWMGLYGELGG